MCFSATASFAVAGATAVAGLFSLRAAGSIRAAPLAAVPLLFAAQQLVEGALWLQLGARGGEAHISSLSLAFLLLAEAFWPAWIPFAVLLIEPGRMRRGIIAAIAVTGLAIGAWLLWRIIETPAAARIVNHSIRYTGDDRLVPWTLAFYLACTCAVLFLSSHRFVRLFGMVVGVGFAVSAWAHYATLISVWCFFAAAASTVLYFHFRTVGEEARIQAPAAVRIRTE